MPIVSSEHASLAWFKLAECVRRGEKERVLSVYRLLMHSFGDEAVSYQLQGDIFSTFSLNNDAAKSYYEAAQRFEQNHRYPQAIYAHECVIAHDTQWYHSYHVLVAWYAQHGVYKRAKKIAYHVIQALVAHGHISRAYETLHSYTTYFSQEQIAQLYELFVQYALQHAHGSADRTMIHTGIAKTIDVYRQYNNEQAVRLFVDALSTVDEHAYSYAQKYWDTDSQLH